MLRTGGLCPSVQPRRARWFLAGAQTLLILALCLTAATTRAAPKPWFEILRQDDSGIELLLRADEPQVENGVVEFNDFQVRTEHGQPRSWARAVFVAVPGTRGASLQVLQENRRTLAGVVPQTQWDPSLVTAEDGVGSGTAAVNKGDARRASDAWMAAGRYPLETVRVSEVSEQRGMHVVMLEFAPLQYQAAGGAEFVDEIRVRLQFRDRATLLDAAVEDTQLRALVNHATAARWQRSVSVGRSAQPADRATRSDGMPRTQALPATRLN